MLFHDKDAALPRERCGRWRWRSCFEVCLSTLVLDELFTPKGHLSPVDARQWRGNLAAPHTARHEQWPATHRAPNTVMKWGALSPQKGPSYCQCLVHSAQRATVHGELFSPASSQVRDPCTPPTRLQKEPLSPLKGPPWHHLVDGRHWSLAYGDSLPSVRKAGPAARSLPWAPGRTWQPPPPPVRRPRPSRP